MNTPFHAILFGFALFSVGFSILSFIGWMMGEREIKVTFSYLWKYSVLTALVVVFVWTLADHYGNPAWKKQTQNTEVITE